MTRVALSLGSNSDPEHHLIAGLNALQAKFGVLQVSSVFESKPVGFSGANFLNLAVVIDTSDTLEELARYLKWLEDQHGRIRSEPRFSGRTLDIDILTFGDLCGVHAGIMLPREEVVENAHVLCPLAQLCGNCLHAPSGRTYAQLWDAYDTSRQQLWPVNFVWQGQQISTADSHDL
ncbi:MAG: 2-amino-4-hydroxy-6-hydroxymethyldihydropteridine diphosphokinase [Pseudomonadota bacterium]